MLRNRAKVAWSGTGFPSKRPWNRNGGHHADRTECGGKERGYHEEAGMAYGRTGHFSDDRHRDSALSRLVEFQMM